MTVKFSTGLRSALLSTGPLNSALSSSEIRIFGGTVPTSADSDTAGATLLCTIRAAAGAPLQWAPSTSSNVLTKDLSQVWSGAVVNTGLATFYRHVLPSDTDDASTTRMRIQGTVGVAGADMNLGNPQLVEFATQGLSAYSVALPEA